jgi:hypothetical protein
MQLAELSFDAAIETLKSNGAKFATVYRDFTNAEYYARQNPELYEKWKSAKFKADAVKNTIMFINEKVDGAFSWFSNVFGLNGLSVINQLQENKQGLGALPLLPVAYVVGASAAVLAAISLMTSVLGDIYEEVAFLLNMTQTLLGLIFLALPNSVCF